MLFDKKVPAAKRLGGRVFQWVFSFDTKPQARAWVKTGRKVGHNRRVFRINGRYRGYARKKPGG